MYKYHMDRPLCPACNQRFRAVNCHRDGKIYYRSRCEACLRRGRKIKPAQPKWQLEGYKKKPACDRCGFRAKVSAQLLVYHTDGDMRNCQVRNLRTICQNCAVEVQRLDLPWKAGELEADR